MPGSLLHVICVWFARHGLPGAVRLWAAVADRRALDLRTTDADGLRTPHPTFGDRIIGGLPDLPQIAVAFNDRDLISATSVGK